MTMTMASSSSFGCMTLFLSHVIVVALFFHLGSLHASLFRCNICPSPANDEAVSASSSAFGTNHHPSKKQQQHNRRRRAAAHNEYPKSLLSHAVRIPRMEFAARLNLGIPIPIEEPSSTSSAAGNQDVLLLRMPPFDAPRKANDQRSSIHNRIIPLQPAKEALSSCHTVKLVLTRPSPRGQQQQNSSTSEASSMSGEQATAACLAIAVGPHNSYHINKWVRSPPSSTSGRTNNDDNNSNLQPVGRFVWNHLPNSTRADEQEHQLRQQSPTLPPPLHHQPFEQRPPSDQKTAESFQLLGSYLQIRESILDELRVALSNVTNNRNNKEPPTILVMVSNQGHADLFLNFCCAARAVGMDLQNSNLLLFATDAATHQMAQQQPGVSSYYNPQLFQSISENNAAGMMSTAHIIMLAKVYAVELVVSLGYNVLFQEVGIVPYRNDYVSYLQEKVQRDKNDAIDLYFSYGHDEVPGSSSSIFAPYATHSGFYYVQSNVRTKYFFSKLVASGIDWILLDSAMVQWLLLLSEQASLFGLRVKTLQGKPRHLPHDNRNTSAHDIDVEDEAWLFPNGYYFSKQPEYMMRLFRKEIRPFLFYHMNWSSNNKTIQIEFMQQTGDWHVKEDECLSAAGVRSGNGECCVLNPVPVCHYRDMPSPHPCRDSPPFKRTGAKSFW